ncbi:protein cornichon homolog 1 isoform X1 [Herrania umbratica]|uniref:Protein cornichon homolog 1 isoform X1 n=1 Tax=Herrania umbratica TaxID=108875 RepID=A0A6J1A730_9ROSI|nr:protein cornichon homolog 1 isoform X1 [Herrania umbratica]
MAWDLIFWILCFFINIALFASTFYQLLSLSDLEVDHLNPFEASSRINAVVVPEFLLQGLLCALFLLTWHWFMFLLFLPLTAYHLMLYLNRKHLIDVTEVFRDIDKEKKYRYVKLGIYLVLFTLVLFRILAASIFFFRSKFEELDLRSSHFY